MRILLPVSLLVCVVPGALADWEFLVATEEADWYVDQSLTRKRGTMAKVWALQQYATSQPLYDGNFLSVTTQVEIRCHSEQWRILYFSYYPGRMGEGKSVYTQDTGGAWKAVIPGNYSAALYQVGCHPEQSRAPAK